MSAKKRPKVPRELVGLFYRVKWMWNKKQVSESELPTRGHADCVIRDADGWIEDRPARYLKLYRVTVWRKK